MKRKRLIIAGAALAALLGYLYAPLPGPRVAAPSADDCVTIRMWSNGYHSDIGIPADMLDANHPLRQLFPEARSLLIGWGERAFYYSDGTDLWLGLNAILPPSPSTMHVVDGAEQGARYLGPQEGASFAISREGAAALAQMLTNALELDASGAVRVLSEGKVVGRSRFLAARDNFHLFHVCNHWMARALRTAGIDVNTRDKWLARPLIRQARARTPAACPAAMESLS